MIPEQKDMWNRKHAEGQHDFFSQEPSELAEKAVSFLGSSPAVVMDIGCGNGRDTRLYASKGYRVFANDLSEVAITKCQEANEYDTATFEVIDIRNGLPYADNSFDLVSSMLALHYFTDEMTHEVFQDIHRVLKQGGLLAFSCKSRDEKRTASATEVESNIYVDAGGHVLHTFSQEYVRNILSDQFEIISLEEKEAFYTNRVSTEVRCIARKI